MKFGGIGEERGEGTDPVTSLTMDLLLCVLDTCRVQSLAEGKYAHERSTLAQFPLGTRDSGFGLSRSGFLYFGEGVSAWHSGRRAEGRG